LGKFLSLLPRIVAATMLLIILFILLPHWLYFKPHVAIWLSVCLDGEVKWSSRLQVKLGSANHELLKMSYWGSFSTNRKQSWLKISELCVQASFSDFGLPAVVIFAN